MKKICNSSAEGRIPTLLLCLLGIHSCSHSTSTSGRHLDPRRRFYYPKSNITTIALNATMRYNAIPQTSHVLELGTRPYSSRRLGLAKACTHRLSSSDDLFYRTDEFLFGCTDSFCTRPLPVPLSLPFNLASSSKLVRFVLGPLSKSSSLSAKSPSSNWFSTS
jgi:hypothetical protein